VTATVTVTAQPAAAQPHGSGAIVALGGRARSALRRRAGRLRVVLLVFVLLLPLLVTSLLDGR